MFEEIDVRELEYRVEVIEHRVGIDRKSLPYHGFHTPDILKRLENIEYKLGIYKDYPDSLEDVLNRLDDRTLQQIFREIDARDFAVALLGMAQETLVRIKKNFSKKAWSMMCDDVNYAVRYGTTDRALKMAKAKFLNVIYILQGMGEIVVPVTSEEQKNRSAGLNEFHRQWRQDNKEKEENRRRLSAWQKEIFDPLGTVAKAS